MANGGLLKGSQGAPVRRLRRTELTVSGVPKGVWRHQCEMVKRRDGQRCGNWSVPGLYVCRFHGGGSAVARAAGLRRIEKAADTALDEIVRLLGHKDPDIRLRAAVSVLERTGKNLVELCDRLDAEDAAKFKRGRRGFPKGAEDEEEMRRVG